MFTEFQRFDQWWLRALFAALNLLFVCAVWLKVAEDRSIGDNPLSLDMLLLVWLSLGVFTVLFLRTRLITKVDASGVHVRFAPWQRQGRYVAWTQVQGCRVRRYRPLIDFGGWGMRTSMGGRMEAYTTRGDQALELDLGERRSLLIGTQRPEELAAVLRALGR